MNIVVFYYFLFKIVLIAAECPLKLSPKELSSSLKALILNNPAKQNKICISLSNEIIYEFLNEELIFNEVFIEIRCS